MSEFFLEAETLQDLMIKAYQNEDKIWDGEWWNDIERYDQLHIKHQDGSDFKVRYAFYKLCKLKYHGLELYLIFPEHNSIMAFFKDDIKYFSVIDINKNETLICKEQDFIVEDETTTND